MEIRRATEFDADRGSEVLRRSIAELCGEDHGSDPDAIARWNSNKTAETWVSWVRQAATQLYVAEEDDQLLGVCMFSDTGEILLNYVSPDARFRGISKAMLSHMEAKAGAMGLACCTLESTKTAVRFYLAAGYAFEQSAGCRKLKMRKWLDSGS